MQNNSEEISSESTELLKKFIEDVEKKKINILK